MYIYIYICIWMNLCALSEPTRAARARKSANMVSANMVAVALILIALLDLCVSSLRRGHANLLCIVPILKRMMPEGNPLPRP